MQLKTILNEVKEIKSKLLFLELELERQVKKELGREKDKQALEKRKLSPAYEKSKQKLREIYTQNRVKAIEILGGKCIHCGEADPDTFNFHHIDPSTKQYALSTKWKKPWDEIKDEVNKCVILCASCHLKEHKRVKA
jgi:hypothetical protein